MVVVELDRAVAGLMVCANAGAATATAAAAQARNLSAYHDCLLVSLMVTRHSVRASSGSVSVAECRSDALSRITTSPTPYPQPVTILLERGVAPELVEQRARLAFGHALDAERAARDRVDAVRP